MLRHLFYCQFPYNIEKMQIKSTDNSHLKPEIWYISTNNYKLHDYNSDVQIKFKINPILLLVKSHHF